jgi:cell wall-associated NlpC family hydrolase
LPNIPFTIQLGAFSTAERAASHADRLKSEGIDAYYFVDTDGFWKVRFGRFLQEDSARSHAEALRKRGAIDAYFIVHPRVVDPLTDSQEALRENIVQTARRFIGTPYRWGGSSVKSGFDCSGLTMTVYRLNGFELPRSAFSQYRAGLPVARSALARGDLVFFRTGRSSRVSHVGIYSGEDRFIHAPGRGKRIRVASLTNVYFKKRFTGARRYF